MAYVETEHDRTTRVCLTFGWDDRIDISLSRLDAKTNERPAQLKRCPNIDIRLNIEMRCGRWRNGEAYQHYRRRSVTGRHAIIIHQVTWSTNALGACSYALDCKTAADSWSDHASFPGKIERNAHGEFVRATRCDAQTKVPPVCANVSHSFSSYLLVRLQIWT